MRAVDTNILVYARREEAPHHAAAKRLLRELATGSEPWALAWSCLYEFLRVVTHPRIFHPPTPLERALEGVLALLGSPSLTLLTETERHAPTLVELLRSAPVVGNLLHDAHIAALLFEHGVDEILTVDEDFRRFPGLKVTNPFRV